MNEYVTEQGGRFVFAVAPNKNTVYPGYMPDYYRRTGEATNLDRVAAALDGRPYYADLLGALREMEETAYHARDSHWNNLGAVCGYNVLLDTAGKPHETYADIPWTWEYTWDGDLDAMIFPSLGYKDRQAVFDVDWTYEYTSNFHSEEDLLITTEKRGRGGFPSHFPGFLLQRAPPLPGAGVPDNDLFPLRPLLAVSAGGSPLRHRGGGDCGAEPAQPAHRRAGDARPLPAARG